jgi:hypothetical protein
MTNDRISRMSTAVENLRARKDVIAVTSEPG